MDRVSGKSFKAKACTIDGATGDEEITEMWRNHYSDLLNSSSDISKKQEVMARLEAVRVDDEDLFTSHEVEAAINKLKKGKAAGKDGLTSEHFIYSSKKLQHIYAWFLTVCLNMAMYLLNLWIPF